MPAPRSIVYSRVVHLSHVLAPGMPEWPGDPPFEQTPVAGIDTHGYRMGRFAIGEHSGTHANAASTFLVAGESIDQVAADQLIVPAVVIERRRAAE